MAAHFGRTLRRGAATTAVAAVAVAALSASQAPGAATDAPKTAEDSTAASAPGDTAPGDTATGGSLYYTDLPPLNSPSPAPSSTGGPQVGVGPIEAGIPATVLDAYKRAEAELRLSKPGCNLPWQLLAAIGKVESGQARGGRVDSAGNTIGRITGPRLDGHGFAKIMDHDGGKYDGDAAFDRAVGPMQFIPTTWDWAGRDGNADGEKDPNNIYDAALAAGHYLCRNDWDLSGTDGLHAAILSYNNSQQYLSTVLSWLEYYRRNSHAIPDGTGPLPSHRSDGSPARNTTSPRPAPHATTTPPATKPAPGKNGGTTTTPPKSPSTPGTPGTPSAPGTPTTPPDSAEPTTPTESVTQLEDAGTGSLTAMAGHTFAERISTRAETARGAGVAGVRVRFTIVGDTDATFAGGETVAAVLTGTSGIAAAPALEAGEKTGDFTVRASLVGRSLPATDYTATVTARAADSLTRVGDTAMECTAGGEFAEPIVLKATYQGAVADKVAATATLVTSATDDTAIDKGPYFEDADGKAVRTLTGLKTDADGQLKLPTLHADGTTGTFLLRVTTTGGGTELVTLTVNAPAAETPAPTESAGTPTTAP